MRPAEARWIAAAIRRRGESGRAYRDRLRWMFRPFTTTCVVLERDTGPGRRDGAPSP